MFTGLVEEVGTLRRLQRRGPDALATIATGLGPLALGESVSVEGVCLTVAGIVDGGFEAELSAETLSRTTLGTFRGGVPVNLERATPLGGRMGGHIVLGHVDAVGKILSRDRVGEAERTVFWAPADLGAFIAEKGSIAIDGISLTVNGVQSETEGGGVAFDVMLVPHTLRHTTLAGRALSAPINVEVDVLARYVRRILAFSPVASSPADPTHDDRNDARLLEKLKSGGYV
jgi:riboflavin synthase